MNRISLIRRGVGLSLILCIIHCAVAASEAVVLLHGLVRSHESMEEMGNALAAEGYYVLNVDYPSTTTNIEELSDDVMEALSEAEDLSRFEKIHFVTHSMGGILVRSYLSRNEIPNLGRVVMIAPPNQGSELVDIMGDWWIFEKINGPAGRELGTGERATPIRLGPVNFELGIIAGDRTINWINSLLIEGPDDGKVSIDHSKVKGMQDHVIIHATHPFIMKNEEAIRATIRFLESGKFR